MLWVIDTRRIPSSRAKPSCARPSEGLCRHLETRHPGVVAEAIHYTATRKPPRLAGQTVALAFPSVNGHRGDGRTRRRLGETPGQEGILRVFPALSSDILKNRRDAQLRDTAPCSPPAGRMEEQAPRHLPALLGLG